MNPDLPRKGTKARELYELMCDGRWYDSIYLVRRVSHRFSAYLGVLKHKHGVGFEKRRHPNEPKGEVWFQYRLVVQEDGQLFDEEEPCEPS